MDVEYNGNDVLEELGIGQDYDYRGNDVMALGGGGTNVIADGSGDVATSAETWRYSPQEPRYVHMSK